MATSMESAAFSSDGEYFAFSNSDGRLKLWETSSGILKQEYTPSSHLSSTCSCLSWSTEKRSFVSARYPLSLVIENVFSLSLTYHVLFTLPVTFFSSPLKIDELGLTKPYSSYALVGD